MVLYNYRKEREKMKKLKKILLFLFDIINIFLIVWFVISYANILFTNLDPNKNLASWNLLYLLFS